MANALPAVESPLSQAVTPPRRFWWLKRGLAAVVVFLLALLALRLWWGYIARKRMDAAIAAARVTGGPVTIEDWNSRATIADKDNAALLLRSAAGRIYYTPAQTAFEDGFTGIANMTAADRQVLHGMVAANATSIAMARQAATLHQADWVITFTRPLSSVMLSYLNTQRQLALLLRDAALDAHLRGDDAAAAEDLDAMLAQGDAVDRGVPMMINHLVALGIDTVACENIFDIGGEFSIGSGQACEKVQALIGRLLDERAIATAGVQQWYGERMFMLDIDRELAAQLGWNSRLRWPLLPGLQLEAMRIFDQDTAISEAMKRSTYPAAVAGIRPAPPQDDRPSRVLSMVVGMFRPSGERNALTHFRALTERRAAAVLLALREYEVDHAGALPPNLGALVPRYLPAVPSDPFSPAGSPLRYRSTAPGGPMIYSVGQDGVDDGGSSQLSGAWRRMSAPSLWDCRDAVFPLHPPRAAAASQP